MAREKIKVNMKNVRNEKTKHSPASPVVQKVKPAGTCKTPKLEEIIKFLERNKDRNWEKEMKVRWKNLIRDMKMFDRDELFERLRKNDSLLRKEILEKRKKISQELKELGLPILEKVPEFQKLNYNLRVVSRIAQAGLDLVDEYNVGRKEIRKYERCISLITGPKSILPQLHKNIIRTVYNNATRSFRAHWHEKLVFYEGPKKGVYVELGIPTQPYKRDWTRGFHLHPVWYNFIVNFTDRLRDKGSSYYKAFFLTEEVLYCYFPGWWRKPSSDSRRKGGLLKFLYRKLKAKA